MVKKASTKAANILSSILKVPEKVRLAHLGELSVKSLCKNSGKYLAKSCLAGLGLVWFTGQTVDYEVLTDESTEMIEWAVEEELSDALDGRFRHQQMHFLDTFKARMAPLEKELSKKHRFPIRFAAALTYDHSSAHHTSVWKHYYFILSIDSWCPF